jgi:hypothetical protein
MKRLILLIVAFASFAFGLSINHVANSLRKGSPGVARPAFEIREVNPVRVTIPPIKEAANKMVPYDHYYAIVENISSKPVRCYVLGFGTEISNVGSRGFMAENGFGYTFPEAETQALIPGETRMIPIKDTAVFNEEAFAWVDYVEFTDGSTWGDNKSLTRVMVK